MPEPQSSSAVPRDFSSDEMQSALFAQLVVQQSSMAMMLLGKSPHPETGKPMFDLESARLFIEQLEMLQSKTRGNLNKSEESLLNQTLMTVRMAFVEATEHPPAQTGSADATEEKKLPAQESESSEESKKRFSKKFSL